MVLVALAALCSGRLGYLGLGLLHCCLLKRIKGKPVQKEKKKVSSGRHINKKDF